LSRCEKRVPPTQVKGGDDFQDNQKKKEEKKKKENTKKKNLGGEGSGERVARGGKEGARVREASTEGINEKPMPSST